MLLLRHVFPNPVRCHSHTKVFGEVPHSHTCPQALRCHLPPPALSLLDWVSSDFVGSPGPCDDLGQQHMQTKDLGQHNGPSADLGQKHMQTKGLGPHHGPCEGLGQQHMLTCMMGSFYGKCFAKLDSRQLGCPAQLLKCLL
jgi:hypothetical protein